MAGATILVLAVELSSHFTVPGETQFAVNVIDVLGSTIGAAFDEIDGIAKIAG